MQKNGTRVALEGIQGLDIVSNLLEGNTVLSPDYDYYGNVHNDLHANLARAADPLRVHSVRMQRTAVAGRPTQPVAPVS